MYSDKSINSINIQRKKVSYLFSEQALCFHLFLICRYYCNAKLIFLVSGDFFSNYVRSNVHLKIHKTLRKYRMPKSY